MKKVTVICDRCKKQVEGMEDPGYSTAGFYRAGSDVPGITGWEQYMNHGESVLCDECMQNEPRYQATYGTKTQ